MKTLPLSILFFLHFTMVNAQKFTIDNIPLYWTDFVQQSNQPSDVYTASIHYWINYTYSRTFIDGKTDMFLNLQLLLNKGASEVDKNFIRKASQTEKEALLNHEKCHLIIGFINLKKMEDSVSHRHFSVRYKLEIDSIQQYFTAQNKSMNIAYDEDTNHSRNTERQQVWENSLMLQFNLLYAKEDKIVFDSKIKLQID